MSRGRSRTGAWWDESDVEAHSGAPGKRSVTSRVGDPFAQGMSASPGKVTLTVGMPVQLRPVRQPRGLPSQAAVASQRSPGQPLPDSVKTGMEGALGVDFSDVRVHHGDAAEEFGAEAYTQGDDIHFAPGKYDPSSQGGRELIAHELTHVVQQREGRVAAPQGTGVPVNTDAHLEAEADAVGASAARGETARSPGEEKPIGTAVRGDAPVQRKASPSQQDAQAVEPSITGYEDQAEALRKLAEGTGRIAIANARRALKHPDSKVKEKAMQLLVDAMANGQLTGIPDEEMPEEFKKYYKELADQIAKQGGLGDRVRMAGAAQAMGVEPSEEAEQGLGAAVAMQGMLNSIKDSGLLEGSGNDLGAIADGIRAPESPGPPQPRDPSAAGRDEEDGEPPQQPQSATTEQAPQKPKPENKRHRRRRRRKRKKQVVNFEEPTVITPRRMGLALDKETHEWRLVPIDEWEVEPFDF